MANEIFGTATRLAKQYILESMISSLGFIVSDFAVGDQGHDPLNPTLARSPDPGDSEINGGEPPLFGPHTLSDRSSDGRVLSFLITLQPLEAVGSISRYDLIATITESPLGDPVVGTQFLFATLNTPLSVKTDTETKTRWVSVRF